MSVLQLLLDSNVCIELLNGSSATVVTNLAEHDPAQIGVSSVVVAELYYGARISARVAANLRLVEQFLLPLTSLAFDDKCALEYAVLRAELRRLGQPLGANDLLIAATAKANNLTVVTHNSREFGQVPDLKIVDWQERA